MAPHAEASIVARAVLVAAGRHEQVYPAVESARFECHPRQRRDHRSLRPAPGLASISVPWIRLFAPTGNTTWNRTGRRGLSA